MILTRRSFVAASAAALAIPAALRAAPPTASELGRENMIRIADDVWVKRIGIRTWLLSATAPIEGGVIYPANGLIHDGGADLALIDPGWNPAQGEALIAFCRREFGRNPTGAIATHFHEDRTGALAALDRWEIPVWLSPMTRALLNGDEPMAQPPLAEAAFGLELYYPGAAHSPDNIAVWDPTERVLFGGCMIKSTTATGLGNLGDASLPAWAASLERLAARYPTAKLVIPGHGRIGGDAIGKTRDLLAAALET